MNQMCLMMSLAMMGMTLCLLVHALLVFAFVNL